MEIESKEVLAFKKVQEFPKVGIFWLWEQVHFSIKIIIRQQTLCEQWCIWADSPDSPLYHHAKNPWTVQNKKSYAHFSSVNPLIFGVFEPNFKVKASLKLWTASIRTANEVLRQSNTLVSMSVRWTDLTKQLPTDSNHLNENAFFVQNRGQNGVVLKNWSNFRIQHQKLHLESYFH